MANITDHILNESIDTPEFYETVSSWKENSPDAALWSDVIDKINEYARREVASALASRPAEVDDELRRHGNAMSSWLYGLSHAALPFDSWAKKCAKLSSKWDEVAAPSHTTNKEK